MGIKLIPYTPLSNPLIYDYSYSGVSSVCTLFDFVFITFLKFYLYGILFVIICELVTKFIRKIRK